MMCSRLRHGGARSGGEVMTVIEGETQCTCLRGGGACTRRMRESDGGEDRSRVPR